MAITLKQEVLSVFAAANAVGDTPAWIFEDRTWTFAELARRVTAAAVWMRDHGIEPGDRVAFAAHIAPAPMLALFALPTLGAVAVPLHPRFTASETKECIAVIDAARKKPAGKLARVKTSSEKACRLLGEKELAAMLRATNAKTKLPPLPKRVGGHPWAILFTSGTSGKPKGVALSQRALVASANASAEVLPFARRERWLIALTPAHIGGISILTRSLLARKTVVAVSKFDPALVMKAIVEHGVSRLSVVPAMLDVLLQHDKANRLRRLNAVIVGGAACPRSLLETCAARGVKARTTYGMTEASSQITLQREDATIAVRDDAGEPLPGVDVKIAADGLGAAGEGRILVRGPVLMPGYVGGGKIEEWFDTGDRGRLVEGRLVVLGRGADMIVTGGENVAPAEVERAIEAFKGVRQALVFGVPDSRYGQVVAAAVVADRALDERGLARGLEAKLARFKLPRRLALVQSLPRTPGGKPDRAGAARLLAKELRAWE